MARSSNVSLHYQKFLLPSRVTNNGVCFIQRTETPFRFDPEEKNLHKTFADIYMQKNFEGWCKTLMIDVIRGSKNPESMKY